jgi:hypothetical protein
MSALADIQRALNIIRKLVAAEPKNTGLDALIMLNQTAASLSDLLKDKPQTPKPRMKPAPVRKPKVKASEPKPIQAPVKPKSAIRTAIDLAPIKPRPPLSTKPLTF